MPHFDENNFYRTFSRRAFLIGAGQLGLFATLIGRLYYLQIIESEKYTLLAHDNSVKVRLIPPARGQIIDCNKKIIVGNNSNFKAIIKNTKEQPFLRTIEKLGRLIFIEKEAVDKATKYFKYPWNDNYFIIRENLSWAEVTLLEINAVELPCLSLEVGLCRSYPYGPLLSPITGYVASPTVQDQEENNPLLQLPDFKIGKGGLEKTCEFDLRGEAGARYIEVNALGKTVRELSYIKSNKGNDVQLTIDLELQQQVAECLQEHRSASAVVVDVCTGAIQAMVSIPSFDPNAFVNGIGKKEWSQLVRDPLSPLQNKAISGVYSPGSTFKMMVMLAALESKAITPDTTIECRGAFVYGGHRFHCWRHKEGHGRINVYRALSESCDVFFYETALLTGIDTIAEMALRFGLGEKTGIELTGEQTALVPTKYWKNKTKRRSWIPSDTILVGIGQGYVSCTPLQLALMTAKIANGGKDITPHLRTDFDLPESISLDISPMSIQGVQQSMFNVMNNPRGSAYQSRFLCPDVKSAGKTGTAQVTRISAYERTKGLLKGMHRPWHEREHALFVGYAPADAPKYAVAVIVEHAGGGARFAAPIGRDILLHTLGLGKEYTNSVKHTESPINATKTESAPIEKNHSTTAIDTDLPESDFEELEAAVIMDT